MNMEFLKHLQRIQSGRQGPAVMVLVVATQSSSPQIPGARMLVTASGQLYGTVGGGAIEKLAFEHARNMLNNGPCTDFQTYDMNQSRENAIPTGMLCGGTISMYFERLVSPERLFVYGCGHIGGFLIPMAIDCGFQVMAVDLRQEMTNPARFGTCRDSALSLLCVHPVEHAGTMDPVPSDSVVIMTHNHTYDASVLRTLAGRLTEQNMPRYLGMIGSVSKVNTVLDRLLKDGFPAELLNRVRAPIGLKTGGASPAEIAVSIMAEILAVKHRTIHDGSIRSMSGR